VYHAKSNKKTLKDKKKHEKGSRFSQRTAGSDLPPVQRTETSPPRMQELRNLQRSWSTSAGKDFI